jgi:hypothetical protein
MEERSSMFVGVPTPLQIPALTEKQADVLRKAQDELLDEVQQVADRWCARRHKSVEAMFELSMTSLHNPGPAGTAEAWTRWQEAGLRWCNGALHRLSEDTADQMELIATLAKCCGSGTFVPAINIEGSKAESSNGKRKAR